MWTLQEGSAHGSVEVLRGGVPPNQGVQGEPHRDHWQGRRNMRNERISRQKVEEENGASSVVGLCRQREEPQKLEKPLFLLTGEQTWARGVRR